MTVLRISSLRAASKGVMSKPTRMMGLLCVGLSKRKCRWSPWPIIIPCFFIIEAIFVRIKESA